MSTCTTYGGAWLVRVSLRGREEHIHVALGAPSWRAKPRKNTRTNQAPPPPRSRQDLRSLGGTHEQ